MITYGEGKSTRTLAFFFKTKNKVQTFARMYIIYYKKGVTH